MKRDDVLRRILREGLHLHWVVGGGSCDEYRRWVVANRPMRGFCGTERCLKVPLGKGGSP